MDNQEQQYIRGFNHGYLLTKHLPDLVAQLITHVKETATDYLAGFFSGKEEWELEYSREQLGELKGIRKNAKEYGRDLEQ
jgi:hypothetical protein